jgi:serine/threonine-protein kinase
MQKPASLQGSRFDRLGLAFAIVLLGLLGTVATGQRAWLENQLYDHLQQFEPASFSGRLLLLERTGESNASTGEWTPGRYARLFESLNEAGARLIISGAPILTQDSLPDLAQLSALQDLQERTRQARDAGGDVAGLGGDLDDLASRLESFRSMHEEKRVATERLSAIDNLVYAVAVSDYVPSGPNQRSECGDLSMGSAALQGISIRQVPYVELPMAAGNCQDIAYGHARIWPDDDGVVRSVDLAVRTNGHVVPSIVLPAAAKATSTGDSDVSILSSRKIRAGMHVIDTADALRLFTRYFEPSDDPPFRRISAHAIEEGNWDRELARDAIIVVTHPGHVGPNYTIPGLGNASRGEILATAIAVGLLGFGSATMMIGTELALFAEASIWTRMATPALFCVLATTLCIAWSSRSRDAVPAGRRSARVPAPQSVSEEDELDLAFSVLRHQPSDDATKRRLYNLAVVYGSKRQHAKAERVLRHLAGIDPEYRDVSRKLAAVSGAKSDAPLAMEQRESAARPHKFDGDNNDGIGQALGRYQIEGRLGRGAMATVYLGRDPRINRKVAIKAISLAEEFDSENLEEARERFLREAESAGRLNHPEIITIYDAGDEGSVAWLAMEYFKGKPLSDYTQQGKLLDWRKVCDLGARAAAALDFAHRNGVVHRDIKPANMLYDAESDTLRITDFGIARLTDTSRTKTGIILGTPSYMSPEQLAATAVGGASDVFSLGVTMYQMLTGQLPFLADSMPRLMDKITNDIQQPLSAVRPDLPPCLDEVLTRALAKDPAQRFETAGALRAQ